MTDNPLQKRFQPGRRRQRGISLIEILIVLVLLVLGILIIIRLYPSGFFSLESVGNSALADAMGSAAIQAQVQNSAGLPESILPGTTKDLPGTLAVGLFSDAAYDPDVPDTLNYARNVSNETITVPSPRTIGGAAQSVYVVNYGPIVLLPTVTPASVQISNYLTINGQLWQAETGNSSASGPTSVRPQDELQDETKPYQTNFLVDLVNRRIAVPYAPYTPASAPLAASYAQKMIVMIVGSDGNVYTEYLDLPEATKRDAANPSAPFDAGNKEYLPDTAGNYQGGWFDPTAAYGDTTTIPPIAPTPPQVLLPVGVTWTKVMVYRPFQGVATAAAFSGDPYQFTLASANLAGASANPGAIAFNPLAAGGNGVLPLKAQISYQAFSWSILHEDRDIPALSTTDTTVARLTLKNLLYSGAAQQDNTTFTGLAGGTQDMVILNLDTGLPVAGTINNEDVNGTIPGDINVSYATGRLTFPAATLGANTSGRVRIYYAGDAGWTVAVQKAPSVYSRAADVVGNTDPMIGPGRFAFDPVMKVAYFPRCDAGKTVEFDGITATLSGGGTQSYPNVIVALDPITYPLGGTNYIRVDLSGTITGALATGPPSPVTFTAVRGLSARAVVAWKERNTWKVHSVDTVLTRPQ